MNRSSSPITAETPTAPRELTRKGRATRQRIIEGAAAQLRRLGVADTTLDEIGISTGTSRGQLFHYFPGGREDLLLAVARHEAERVLLDQDPYLSDLSSWTAWQSWRDAVVDRYRSQGPNCPLAALMSQVRHTPGAAAVTRTLLTQWEARLAAGVTAMQDRGQIPAEVDAQRTGQAIVAAVQGGVAVLMATGRISHLEAALDLVLAQLQGHRLVG